MNESEQAQAIVEIRAAHKGALNIIAWDGDCEKAVNVKTVLTMMGKLLEIVDSQAQKIKHQQAEINVKTTMLNDMNELCAEQANEIGRLKSEVSK